MQRRSMYLVASAILAAAGFLMVFGFAPLKPGDYPGTDAQELWKYITEEKPYTTLEGGGWHFLRGWEGRKPGQAPHGAGIITYVNDVAYKAAMEKKTTLPEHSIVVKENYAPAEEGNKQSALWPNAKLAAVTVMYKVKGYNPDANDWYWVKYNADGTVDKRNGMALAGKPAGCINCHATGSGAANDYLIGYDLAKGQPAK